MKNVFLIIALAALTVACGKVSDEQMLEAKSLIEQQEFTKALGLINERLEATPDDYFALLFKGKIYAQTGKRDSALTLLNLAIQSNPRFGEAYAERAWYFAQQGEYYKANADADLAVKSNMNDLTFWELKGLFAYQAGLYKEAVQAYTYILSKTDTIKAIYQKRGTAHLATGNYADGIQDLNKALQEDSNNVFVLSDRAVAYIKTKEYGLAQKDLNHLLQVQTTNTQNLLAVANNNLGYIAIQNGNYESALPYLNKAIEQNNNEYDLQNLAYALNNKATAFLELYNQATDKNLADSAQFYSYESLQILPQNVYALQNYLSTLAIQQPEAVCDSLESYKQYITNQSALPEKLNEFVANCAN